MALDYSFTKEQEFFRQTVRNTVDRLIMPRVAELDEKEEFPWDLWKEFAALGYLGLRHEEKYGGVNTDIISQMIFYEELARGSCGFAMSVIMQALMGTYFIDRFGNEEIKERILVPAIKGEKIGTICFTEEQSGSDLAGTRARAKKAERGWRISGRKQWITNGPVAEFATVLATVDPALGLKGLNFFLVERKTENRDGFVPGQKFHKLGSRCSVTGELVFDDVFIPDDNLLGKEIGKGVQYLGDVLNEVRVMTAMNALAIAKGAMNEAKSFAKNRIAFGNPISEYQLIREKFAKFWAWYEASWNFAYKCAWMIQNKLPCTSECTMAKYFATEMCMNAVDEGMRICGANAFSTEYPIQRYWRDSRFLLYGGGTHEVLCNVLGRAFLKD